MVSTTTISKPMTWPLQRPSSPVILIVSILEEEEDMRTMVAFREEGMITVVVEEEEGVIPVEGEEGVIPVVVVVAAVVVATAD
jgi:hypothetical protein